MSCSRGSADGTKVCFVTFPTVVWASPFVEFITDVGFRDLFVWVIYIRAVRPIMILLTNGAFDRDGRFGWCGSSPRFLGSILR